MELQKFRCGQNRKGFVLTFAVMFFFISYFAFLLDYIRFEHQDYFVFENIPYIIDDIVSDLDVMIQNNSKIIDIRADNGSIYIKDVMGKEKRVSELGEPKKYDVFLKYTPRTGDYGIEAELDVDTFLDKPQAQIYSAGNYRIYLEYDQQYRTNLKIYTPDTGKILGYILEIGVAQQAGKNTDITSTSKYPAYGFWLNDPNYTGTNFTINVSVKDFVGEYNGIINPEEEHTMVFTNSLGDITVGVGKIDSYTSALEITSFTNILYIDIVIITNVPELPRYYVPIKIRVTDKANGAVMERDYSWWQE